MERPIDAQHYLRHMNEVKHRMRAVDWLLGAKKPRVLKTSNDDEIMWLQIRQIIELVAFASIASDRERYARYREAKKQDYSQDWKARNILKWLASISPHFLPQPMSRMGVKPQSIEQALIAATKDRDELVRRYDQAGTYLHAQNPFDSDGVNERLAANSRSRLEAAQALGFLRSLLREHWNVGLDLEPADDPTELANPNHAWIVNFGHADNPRVQMWHADAVQGHQTG